MKKIIIFIIGIIIFSANSSTFAYNGVYGVNGKAGEIAEEIETLKEDIGKYNSGCDNPSARIKIRLAMMSDTDVIETIKDSQKNTCLRKDLDYLEKELGKIATLAPVSEIACGAQKETEREFNEETVKVDINYATEKIKELRKEINCLRKFGANENLEKEEGECEGDYFDPSYNNEEKCPDLKSKSIFGKLKQSYDELEAKIKTLDKIAAMIEGRDFFNFDYDKINANAKKNAEDWMKKNLSIKYKGKMFSFGVGYLTDSDKEKLKFKEQKEKEKEPERAEIDTAVIRSEVFGRTEEAEENWQFAKNFSQLIVYEEMFQTIDLETVQSLEHHLNCLQFSYTITTISSNKTTADTPAGCIYPIKKLADKTTTDGLKEKTRAMKIWLDSHNKK